MAMRAALEMLRVFSARVDTSAFRVIVRPLCIPATAVQATRVDADFGGPATQIATQRSPYFCAEVCMQKRIGILVAAGIATAALLTACSTVSRTRTLTTVGSPPAVQNTQIQQFELEPALNVAAPAQRSIEAPAIAPVPAVEKPAPQAAPVKAESAAAVSDKPVSAKPSEYHEGYTCPGKGRSESRASSVASDD
jgi:hypothetical protein